MQMGNRLNLRRGAAVFGILMLMLMLLLFSREVSSAMQGAIRLCMRIILPTLFPFMVLSDLLVQSIGDADAPAWLSRITHRLFRVPASALLPFLLGALCGFPIGVKNADALYREGRISAGEYANLLCFVNNTGPAFVIAAVGTGLFSSVRLGVLLYSVQLVSALMTGAVLWPLPV